MDPPLYGRSTGDRDLTFTILNGLVAYPALQVAWHILPRQARFAVTVEFNLDKRVEPNKVKD